ncbi:hypothetical protein PTSG_07471 [Salpingoeca rosetta]|uniref:Condensin complex subunit 1 C-terminal domain-containing protein n=1 Tax=Salpingoeca rosetta (strain ATCC 50818 / BSB-021) TaxID=946362 RepID=F2UIT8_SALR5|nr:uncharacterized protein PTSG_07471 [Salpingoeca rosetta]EGD77137.1 hypothetical protein PTSG_07471 [Salpingoeca rosetta]|eukprot:XP_004990976.1 hypothetical protein PTSG_07471 [Salpingoeca rosetta]
MAQAKTAATAALTTLHVVDAPPAFVTEAWDHALVDLSDLSEPLPIEEDVHSVVEALKQLANSIAAWQGEEDASDTFWIFLAEQSCSVRALVAVLAFHIDAKDGAELAAASVYLRLLLLPGASAHKTYTPMLCRRACQAVQAAIPTVSRSTGSSAKTAGAAADEDVRVALAVLARVAASPIFPSIADSTDIVVEVLAQASRTSAPTTAALTRDQLTAVDDIATAGSISAIAFAGLYALCTRSDMRDATRLVFKNLLQTLNMSWTSGAAAHTTMASSSSSSSSSSFTQAQLRVRNLALSFLDVLSTSPDAVDVCKYLRIMGQHLCTTVADRAAHREQGAQAFVHVLRLLPVREGLSLASWLHHFSRSSKTAHRTLAIEYVAHVLIDTAFWTAVTSKEALTNTANTTAAAKASSGSDTSFSPASTPVKSPSQQSSSSSSPSLSSSSADVQRKLVQLIFLRCSDKAVNVRVRALRSLRDIAAAAAMATDGHDGSDVNGSSGIARLKEVILQLYREASIQDLAATASSALLSAASSSPVPPPSSSLLSSHSTTDNGSAENTHPTQTPARGKKGSQQQDTLSHMLLRRLADSKGAVRKVAVAAAEAILLLLDSLTAHEIESLTGRCRDPVLSVRRQALESAHRVLAHHRHSEVVRRSFFESALPLMLDNEETVRTKCTSIVASVLLDGVLEETSDLTDSLLEWLAEHPEYRRYVQRGCADWQRNKQITSKHIKALFSRVDNGKTAAWSFLSIVATQGGMLVDPALVYKYWSESVLENTSVSSVILTILNAVGDRMTQQQRSSLTGQLKRHVLGFSLPPPLIAIAMATITKFDALDNNSKEGLAKPSVEFCRQVLHKCRDCITTTQSQSPDETAAARHIFTLGEAAMVCPQSVDDALVLPLQAIIARADKERNPILRAHAYLALGKVCLQREELAKTWISSMARELDECPDAAVRNNIVVIMADLCIRYTTFVERYIPTLAGCLRDESPLVRRQALMLLTRLLTEDYIKLKGVLFFRLLVTLVDDDMQVRNLANFCLIHLLFARDPTIFRAHFVEAVYHLNDHRQHPTYNRLPQSDADRARFNFTGVENRTKREYMYRIMLQHCTDVDRLNITQDLCQGVLNAVADEELELNSEMQNVLTDALLILSSKDIKLGKATDTSGDLEDEEDKASGKAAVKAQLISKIAKKNLVQNILPIVVQLKNALDRKRSPLQRNIMLYLREVMADHRDEVEELLSANQQLAREIKFDLEQFEKEARSRRVSVMSLAATPSRMTPRLRSASTAPSPFLAGMDTPNFKAPRLRTQQSGLRRQSRSDPARTPLRSSTSAAAFTPVAMRGERGRGATAGMTTPLRANPLAWVRTPASKLASSKKPGARTASTATATAAPAANTTAATKALGRLSTVDDVETDVIVLESPADNTRVRRAVSKWPLPPPVFKTLSSSSDDDDGQAKSANANTTAMDEEEEVDPLLSETPMKRSKEVTA